MPTFPAPGQAARSCNAPACSSFNTLAWPDQARPITAVDITQGYGVYDNLRQPREYEPDTKPRTRVNSMASHGPTLYEVPSEVSSYDGAPTYDAEPKMARTITPKLDRPAVQEHHRSSDYDQASHAGSIGCSHMHGPGTPTLHLTLSVEGDCPFCLVPLPAQVLHAVIV